ncbi:Hypothetical protein RG1141_PA08060 (plasmid) [Neorhizobium galegae bv. officinalis bv. officinalis str. HAMBI 1141]|uniref:Uncharacterized protein n=1 Tax=Neorhizobium galegae bv. officinalis bv. officinalis str. HAMBI 1141 TaxID=1028801 RepID=A0A068TGY2_NEOGA|nr:Hypothetical protein RG1141_PA08060 [Neorhizobium galegae bv. officinalis bv. officinalis str. HAMBI 1141]
MANRLTADLPTPSQFPKPNLSIADMDPPLKRGAVRKRLR